MPEVTGSGLALPPASTTRRGVDPSKFMGATAAAGKSLEKRVATNEKKITLLKNILKMRQQSENIGGVIKGIAESVDSIAETTELQYQEDLNAAEDERLAAEKGDADSRENQLEKKEAKGIGVVSKVMAPVVSVFNKILGFLTTFLLGSSLMKLIDWFGDSKNTKKVESIKRFLSDWWPVIVGGLIAFCAPMLGTAGVIIGTIALLAWGVPKIIDAVKSLFGFGKDTENQLGEEEKGLDETLKNEDSTIGATFAAAEQQIKDNDKEGGKKEETPSAEGDTPPAAGDTPPEKATGDDLAAVNEERVMFGQQELSSPPEQEEKTEKFAEGGYVRGPGGIDNVPARLTAGEFVMSKGAVEKWGPDMLAGMNARGGGTNAPVNLGFNGGGLVDLRPNFNESNTTNNVIPTENLLPYEGKEYRKKFQFGGSVTGRGGRDNVPAKLTAGEFVMSRSAVKNFGAKTFASMNALGGGTNVPVEKHFAGGGLVTPSNVEIPVPPSTKGHKIIVTPVPVGDNSSTIAGPQGSGSNVPSFGVVAWGGEPKELVLGIRR